MKGQAVIFLTLAAASLPRLDVAAHPAYLTAAQVTVESDGRFHAQLRFDTLAFALNDTSARIGNEPMDALMAGSREGLEGSLAKAKLRLAHGFRLVTDAGDAVVETVDFPEAAQVLAWRDMQRPVLPVIIPASVVGHLPPGVRTVACRFPSVLERVILTVERPDEEPVAEAVDAGRSSTPLPLRLNAPAAMVTVPLGIGNHAALARQADPAATGSRFTKAWIVVLFGPTLACLGLLGLCSSLRRKKLRRFLPR